MSHIKDMVCGWESNETDILSLSPKKNEKKKREKINVGQSTQSERERQWGKLRRARKEKNKSR